MGVEMNQITSNQMLPVAVRIEEQNLREVGMVQYFHFRIIVDTLLCS